jgi:hypothetical protein
MDLSNGLHGCNIFSKIDLVKGYHQIPVAAADIPKMAIIRPFGLFEYLFTLFGLSNAAQTFQRMIDTIDDLDGVFAYMDESSVGSWTGKHTFYIWKLSSMLWPPMVLLSTLKMRFCSPLFRNSRPHDFGDRIDPQGRSCRRNRVLPPPPPGNQATAMVSGHGKLSLPFCQIVHRYFTL